MNPWQIFFDGACEPQNPGGWMTWGFVVFHPDGTVTERCGSVRPAPENTNNTAEWLALGHALRFVRDAGDGNPGKVIVRGDSQLVINQLRGDWQCKKAHLGRMRARCVELLHGAKWTAEWVAREHNEQADALTRRAYVEATGHAMPERAPKRRAV